MTSPPRPEIATLDLNADLGEGFGPWTLTDDDAMLELVTSANIACGFHAGDPNIMRRVCSMAAGLGVRIGAHIGYNDLAGFGRREIVMSPRDLENDVLYQIGALDAFCRVAGSTVSYVKPHGALNNRMWWDSEHSEAVATAVSIYNSSLPILVLPNSALEQVAHALGLTVITEAYLDRGYSSDGNLVPRGHPSALLKGRDAIKRRIHELVSSCSVTSVEGARIDLHPRSICIHGDGANPIGDTRAVRSMLKSLGVRVEAFA